MKICDLTGYEAGKGDIVVLIDLLPPDGIHVHSQHTRIEEAIAEIAKCNVSHVALVKVIDVNVTEIQKELPI
jgi:hypothetical protein